MLIRMADGGGSGPASGTPGSMAFEVDPDRLYATANQFEDTARTLSAWVTANRNRFAVKPAGADTVSQDVAEFFTKTAGGDGSGGALDQALSAAENLGAAAAAMRAAAQSYGLTDSTAAGDLTGTNRT